MSDIAILVTSLPKVVEKGLNYVFTDRHAYVQAAQFFNELTELNCIDWAILQRRDFRRNPDDPGKTERYQAEALIHRVVPVSALLGIACQGPKQLETLESEVKNRSLQMKVLAQPEWYF